MGLINFDDDNDDDAFETDLLKVMENSPSNNFVMDRQNFYQYLFDNDIEKVSRLLKDNELNVNEDENGNYPLYIATTHGNIEMMKLLIEKGAEVDVFNRGEQTPLLECVFRQNTAGAQFLVEQGANPFIQNKHSISPALKAAQTSQVDLLKEFLLLEKSSYSVDKKDNMGNTLLMYAAMLHDSELLTTILNQSPDFSLKNLEGKNALDFANEFCWDEAIHNITQLSKKQELNISSKPELKEEVKKEEPTQTGPATLVSKINRRRPG